MTDPPALPGVTIVIANHNGRAFLPACLASLACQDYPAAKVRILVVDNASSDDSVAWLRANYPAVDILELDRNYGFAAANNRAAQAAATELVAFLNNDTRASPGWLSALVAQRQAAPDIAAVASCILSWDGQEIDFVRGVLSYIGMAYQRDEGRPAALRPAGAPYELLFACGGAMLVDRRVFLACGGFDERFFAYFEDVDLGWRLWLMGYRVVAAPDAVVYHRGHGTAGRLPFFQRLVLFERNALRMLYKNCEEHNFWRLFSGTLLHAFARQASWLAAQGWQPGEWTLGAAVDEGLLPAVGREGLSITVAVAEVIDDLSELTGLRRQIQDQRRRPDAAIYPLFVEPLRPYIISQPAQDNAYAVAHYAISAATGITPLFSGLPRRILILTAPESEPARGPEAPPEVRAWHLAVALDSCGHEVIVSAADGPSRPAEPHFQVIPLAADNWQLMRSLNPDVVVACHPAVITRLAFCHLPLVLDVAWRMPAEQIAAYAAAWERIDFFTCAGADQLAYYLPCLRRSGFDAPERQAAALELRGSPSPDAGLVALDGFCRLPYKRRAGRRLLAGPAMAAAGRAAQNAMSAAPRARVAPRSARRPNGVWHQARRHYRRGGLKALVIEILGFLQRFVAAHF